MQAHTPTEDAVAICVGVTLFSVGVAFLTSAGLLTGGMAGLAFVLHYATGIGFGKLFFVLNLPFYWLALRKLGLAFTLKTFVAVALLSALSELQSQLLQISQLQPLYAAITGGLIMGMGFLVLFRHRCSSERVYDLRMAPVAPQRQWMQGANRRRAGGPARICNTADATFEGQPYGQGRKTPHSVLPTLARPPAWPAAGASIAAFCGLAGAMRRS